MRLRNAGLSVLLVAILCSFATGTAWAQSNVRKNLPAASAASNKPATRVAGGYGNWTLLCGKEGNDKSAAERCSLVLPLIEKETQKLIFRVILTYGPKGRLVLRVDGPTGVALQRGVEFSPDSQKIYRMLQDLMKSKQGTITVFALIGQAIKTVALLDGFSKGLNAMDKQRQQKQ